MANMTIRGIPDEVYAALKESAERNRRSLNNEVICLIERAMDKEQHAVQRIQPEVRQERDVQRILAEAREVRKYTANSPITIDDIMDAIDEGRP